ncbi:MAG: hypothetical protein JWP77_828 [Polaromonas sp.]|nr:hypothetical protein [Polaromonas sp.]
MEATEHSRRQLIASALTQHPDTVAQTSARLWQLLAPELISIIGEGGFKPLYARSIRLASRQHPWLAHDGTPLAGNEGFAELQACQLVICTPRAWMNCWAVDYRSFPST